jgi:aspartyl-tRNA(Asn)/glutamyl-tRNA(Gln) amidotransferase subunit B
MTYIISGKNYDYEIVVGCEIHAQIASNSKLFSRSATEFGAPQNSQVSFIDAAMPGMLPMLNQFCVKQTIKTGLAINGKINLFSVFDRKNYFYPDLPQGYQISQFTHPIVSNGFIEITNEDNVKKTVTINRIHIEQDAGKSIHDQDPNLSLIDLNRSGVALMEIVSDPNINSPFEACEYVKKIRALLRSIGSSDGDMEKGNLRCDANVSVRKVGSDKLGTRCEIKNLNSIKNISRAIEFEAQRQVDLLDNGHQVSQETRLFDAINGETRTMRSKEDAMDYRYFPDPDLAPLIISEEFINQIKAELPELPDDKKARYITDYSLSEYDAGVLTSDTEISDYFEKLVAIHDPKLASNWLTVELFGRMNKLGLKFSNLKTGADDLIELLDLIKSGEISGKIAKDVLDIMIETAKKPNQIIIEHGFKQVSDGGEIEKIIDKVLADNQAFVTDYKSGKEKLFGFFVGQIMKESKGQANPQIVNDILKKKLLES